MNPRLRLLTAGSLLWAAPLLSACWADGAGGSGAPTPKTHIVEIRDMEFRPAELTVRVGDTIVWINRDFVPHTATAPDSAWTSPPLAQGDRWKTVASGPEAGHYVCAFHPVMKARLIVDPSPSSETTP